MALELVILIFLIAVAISGGIWTFYYVLKRAKKAYWELYLRVVQIEERVGLAQQQTQSLVEQQASQMKQQIGQVQHHLLLEHLASVAIRAKENDLISADTFDKSMQLFHELEMDNLQAKKSPKIKL